MPSLDRKLDYDLVAIDLDGTLLNTRHELPPENRAALHRVHQAGLHIVLCTGRSYPETCPVLDEIGLDLDAVVTVFGAMISDVRTGQTLERVAIPLNLAFRLCDWLLDRGLTVMWLNDAEQAGFDGYVVDGVRRPEAVDRWVQRTPCRVSCVARLPADAYAPVRISIIDDLEVLRGVSADLKREFGDLVTHNLLRAPAYDLTILEAFAPGVNKWYAIERLCRRWVVNPARTVAIGDDVNDLDMVRRAGLGIAMSNAHPDVRAVARRTTTDNDSFGVAKAIDELLAATGARTC